MEIEYSAAENCDETHKAALEGYRYFCEEQYSNAVEHLKSATDHLPGLLTLWPMLSTSYLKVHSYYPAEEAAR